MASWVFQLHSFPVDLKVKFFGINGFKEVFVRDTGDDLRRWAINTGALLQHILWLNQLRFIQFIEDDLIIPEITASANSSHTAQPTSKGASAGISGSVSESELSECELSDTDVQT